MRLGQHDVATLLGISVNVLARYEDGQERAPASILLELTRHLGCPLTDLFAGMPSMDADDDFQGSRLPPTEPGPAFEPPYQPSPDPRIAPSARVDPGSSGRPDALAVTGIIRAFSDLTDPLVRERLLGLLQALA